MTFFISLLIGLFVGLVAFAMRLSAAGVAGQEIIRQAGIIGGIIFYVIFLGMFFGIGNMEDGACSDAERAQKEKDKPKEENPEENKRE